MAPKQIPEELEKDWDANPMTQNFPEPIASTDNYRT